MSYNLKFAIYVCILPVIVLVFGLCTGQYNIAMNSALTILCISAISYVCKRYSFLTSGTYYSLIIFIMLSVFAGRTLNIYTIVPYWDKILHFLSGFVLVWLGKDIYVKLNDNLQNTLMLKLFALVFAIAAAGLWEIYEFTIDGIFGTVSQNGSLTDTMWDMIAGSGSAVIAVWFVARAF